MGRRQRIQGERKDEVRHRLKIHYLAKHYQPREYKYHKESRINNEAIVKTARS